MKEWRLWMKMNEQSDMGNSTQLNKMPYRRASPELQTSPAHNCLRDRKSRVLYQISQILNIDNQFIYFYLSLWAQLGPLIIDVQVQSLVFKKQIVLCYPRGGSLREGLQFPASQAITFHRLTFIATLITANNSYFWPKKSF